jgi:hypothetical protein
VAGDVPAQNVSAIQAEMAKHCDMIQAPVPETYNSLTVRHPPPWAQGLGSTTRHAFPREVGAFQWARVERTVR